jgi:CheY-like chemotaxis protein
MAARILVIEDNGPSLRLMTYLLRAFGYEPLSAADGEDGLRIAEQERPDLVICDIQLPRLDGYGVARALRSGAGMGAGQIIAVTASAMVGDRERVLAAGFDGYITKPITPETFVSEAEAFLPADLRAKRAT